MASLFDKDPGSKPPVGPYARERIDKEIAHLRNRDSVRHLDRKGRGYRAAWPALLAVAALVGLFFMDPVLHAFRRSEAVRDYLYLHHFGSDRKAADLLATGLFSPGDIELLNQRQGAFQGYYSSPVEAGRVADGITGYVKDVTFLHAGAYDRLSPLSKIRYQLFVRWGIIPPISWSLLDQPIHD